METRSNHVLVGAVVLILLAVLALFTVWIARLGGTKEKEYDIFFKQSVDGLAKGSSVTYSGVPSGQRSAAPCQVSLSRWACGSRPPGQISSGYS